MSIGLFGGTFDPIHFGHLRAALEVKEGFGLDQVFLIPAATPPHKKRSAVTDASDRLKMLELSVPDHSGIVISDVELKRPGPSYTIDTIYHFKKSMSPDNQIYLMVGLDAFLEIDTWKSYQKLLEQVAFIVMARPFLDGQDFSAKWNILQDFLHAKISRGYKFSDTASCFVHPRAKPVYVFDVTLLDISGTRIRKLVKHGKSIEFLVPEKVEKYIQNRGLYL